MNLVLFAMDALQETYEKNVQRLEKYPTCATMRELYSSTTSLLLLMANICQITGKGTQVGGRYSNRTRATQFNPCGKVRRRPNLQTKSIFVPELGKSITVTASTKGLRTIAKNGAFQTLKAAGLI
jgi:large subunit ribosomal protein L28